VFVVLFGYLSRGRDRQHHKTPERKVTFTDVTFTSIHITERRGQRVCPTTVPHSHFSFISLSRSRITIAGEAATQK
jgi:hypothetical protein